MAKIDVFVSLSVQCHTSLAVYKANSYLILHFFNTRKGFVLKNKTQAHTLIHTEHMTQVLKVVFIQILL